jgi:bacteriorhodopsin
MRNIIVLLALVGYTTAAASAQARCVKWSWYNIGNSQKIVCLHWEKR